jgi:uncharacterized protein YjiS (DUF1127 family)
MHDKRVIFGYRFRHSQIQTERRTLSMRPSVFFAIVEASWRRFRAAVRTVERWRALAAERRQLAMLDDRLLKDIGITRVDARREARRPFWDDPLKEAIRRQRGSRSNAMRPSADGHEERFAASAVNDSLFCRKPL